MATGTSTKNIIIKLQREFMNCGYTTFPTTLAVKYDTIMDAQKNIGKSSSNI